MSSSGVSTVKMSRISRWVKMMERRQDQGGQEGLIYDSSVPKLEKHGT